MKAYAKVNLLLKVISKLDSRYHNLLMYNAKIDLFDEIDICENSDGIDKLIFLNTTLDGKYDDLVLKCLKEIKTYYNIDKAYTIKIYKNIPIGAGLGGGSVDCALVVKDVLKRNNIKQNNTELINILDKYGADIPYSLIDDRAICRKTGSSIYITSENQPLEAVIVYPNVVIKTKDVFENNKQYSPDISNDELLSNIKEKGYNYFSNDLLESTCDISAEVKSLYEYLKTIGYPVMTGSGSSFLVYGNDIDEIYNKIKNKYKDYFVRKVHIK